MIVIGCERAGGEMEGSELLVGFGILVLVHVKSWKEASEAITSFMVRFVIRMGVATDEGTDLLVRLCPATA
jgi:hypothetical protein